MATPDKISVIMSMYNAQDTVGRAIHSVLNQTFKNIELIVIDDCSTDSSNSIVSGIAQKDPRIKLYRQKINRGAGLARRRGIEESTGNLISFVDSDDELYRDYLEVLVRFLNTNNADIVWGSTAPIYSPSDKVVPRIGKVTVDEGKNVLERTSFDKKYLSGSLSRKRCWKDIQYLHIRYIEDTPTMFMLLHNCKKGVHVCYKGYYYQNPNSLCHTTSKLKDVIYRALGMVHMLLWEKERYGALKKSAFIVTLKELGDALKSTTWRQLYIYRKELFTIFKFFVEEVI